MKKSIIYVFLFILSSVLQAQVEETWNLDVETYTHNTSNYSERNPPIGVIKYDSLTFIVLTQNKSLSKIDLKGNIIWKIEIPKCSRQRVIKSQNQTIFLICGKRLKKFNTNGVLLWEKNYADIFKDTHALINDIKLGENGILYLVGHFWYQSNKIFLSAIDVDGNILWEKTFKQGNENSNSITQPKEILIKKNKIFILAQERGSSGSYLYVTDINGKKRKEVKFEFEITKIKADDNIIKTVGHYGSLKDYLIISKFDNNLNILKQNAIKLPQNMIYEKAIRFYSFKISKKKFNEHYQTTYTVTDFQYLNEEELVVVGNSFGQPWIIKINEDTGIIWNWTENDKRYYKFDKKFTEHHYTYHSISKIDNEYLLTGLAQEKDNDDWLKTYLNLFIRKIQIN